MLKNIKESIGRQLLKGEMSAVQRQRKASGMEEALTIGILFDASETEDYELVRKYVNYLKELKKKPKAIGFFSTKEIPQTTYAKLEFDYFSHKDVMWNGKPTGVAISNFINEEYDILIDLNIYDRFPLHYIAACSRARFKVGKRAPGTDAFLDMTIESGGEKGLKFLLRNIDTYLTMLNKKEKPGP